MRLFQTASLYVMPAISEPNGITYLEALANKTPIVGLNRFAFPEFCGYGKYGFIVDENRPEKLASVILKAFNDMNRLKEMGLKGQAFVRNKYTWDSVAEKMMKEFKTAIEYGK